MTEHTSGSWEAIPPKAKGKHWKIGARGKLGGQGSTAGASVLWFVATIDNGAPGDTLETEKANAQIMAASKEMLAALESVYALRSSVMNEAAKKGDRFATGGTRDRFEEAFKATQEAINKAKGIAS